MLSDMYINTINCNRYIKKLSTFIIYENETRGLVLLKKLIKIKIILFITFI